MSPNGRRMFARAAAVAAIAVSAFVLVLTYANPDEQPRGESFRDMRRAAEPTAFRQVGRFDGETIECNVRGVIVLPGSDSPTVILATEDGTKFLPIVVGLFEGMAISRSLEGVGAPRPMTHDLLANIVKEMGGEITRATITEMRAGTYFAQIEVTVGEETHHIDARPSDSIALALKVGAPIFASVAVIETAGESLEDAPDPDIRPRPRPLPRDRDPIGDPI